MPKVKTRRAQKRRREAAEELQRKEKAATGEAALAKPKEGEERKPRRFKPTPITTEEREKIEKQAIAEIREALEKLEAGDRKLYVPDGWATRYKTSLGTYKYFLQRHPDKFAVIEKDPGSGDFILRRREEVPLLEAPSDMPWQKALLKAWSAYCQVMGSTRSFEGFALGLPKHALFYDMRKTRRPEKEGATGGRARTHLEEAEPEEPAALAAPARCEAEEGLQGKATEAEESAAERPAKKKRRKAAG